MYCRGSTYNRVSRPKNDFCETDYTHDRSRMCLSVSRPAVVSWSSGFRFRLQRWIQISGYQREGGALFHLPPTIKGAAGLFKGEINGHKRSDRAQCVGGGDDKTFSGSVFFPCGFPRSRRAGGIKWLAAGIRQLICLLIAVLLSPMR